MHSTESWVGPLAGMASGEQRSVSLPYLTSKFNLSDLPSAA